MVQQSYLDSTVTHRKFGGGMMVVLSCLEGSEAAPGFWSEETLQPTRRCGCFVGTV